MNAYRCAYVCVWCVLFTYGIRFSSSKLLMWVSPAATVAERSGGQEREEGGGRNRNQTDREQVIMWVCQLTWLQHTHTHYSWEKKVQIGFFSPHLSTSLQPPRSRTENLTSPDPFTPVLLKVSFHSHTGSFICVDRIKNKSKGKDRSSSQAPPDPKINDF